jgi:hypothetical protein
MWEFTQVEGSGPPMDIEAKTDDSNAELAELRDLFNEGEFEPGDWKTVANFDAATAGEDGLTMFVIPGDEAGEISDYWDELGAFLHECNQKAMAAAEAEAEKAASA